MTGPGDHAPDHDHDRDARHDGNDGPPVLDGTFWEERYRSGGSLWSGRPNGQLVAEVADLPAGRALDVGCGEGADSVWLARQGWEVTAVDISPTALDRARGHAGDAGPEVAGRISWVHADVTDYVPTSGGYDLVTAQFVHLPGAERRAVHDRLADAVAEGGVLLIVTHDPSDLGTTVRRPPSPDLYATASEVAAALPDDLWDVLVAEARPRPAKDSEGRTVTVHDAVLVARRRVGTTGFT